MQKEDLKKYYYDVFKADKMVNYCLNEIANIIELSNNTIIVIDKPTIKKSFCFGYGFCGISTEEEENNAYKMSQVAKTNHDYFMQENLKHINERIEEIKNSYKVYIFNQYYRQSKNNILRTYYAISRPVDEERFKMNSYENVEEITEADKMKIVEGLEQVKKEFIKRLETYLKKYGLSKIRSWTYLSD